MKLSALIWTRYRSFKTPQRLNLAPLTLIIGKNGSGKSVITRLPIILSAAISRNPNGPIDLSAGGVDHGASLQDLVNERSGLAFGLGMEVSSVETTLEFETTLRYVNETKSLAIERFSLRKNSKQLLLLDIAAADQLTAASPRYNVTCGPGLTTPSAIEFEGLLPQTDAFNGDFRSELLQCFTSLRDALPLPSYLGPFREEPTRLVRFPNQAISALGPKGEQALELLADDRLRRGGGLADQVQNWFRTSMGQGIEVDVSGDLPRAYAVNPENRLKVGLADTGAGFSQAIPVVVQNFAFRSQRIKSNLLIVEQPELHLHPAAHGALADLYLDSATETKAPSATCIIETHSEQFIMRVRRRIGEGLPSSTSVIASLNHVDAQGLNLDPDALRIVTFDAAGDPDSWPAGVFEEAFDDLTRLRQAARASAA